MVKFLAIQVRLGKINLTDVPEKYREAVAVELAATDGCREGA